MKKSGRSERISVYKGSDPTGNLEMPAWWPGRRVRHDGRGRGDQEEVQARGHGLQRPAWTATVWQPVKIRWSGVVDAGGPNDVW